MKTMKYLGCLLALVFAGASAFAESNGVWFENVVDATLTGWTGSISWDSDKQVAVINDWSTGATYTKTPEKSLESAEATYTTTVKFTPMDIEDIVTQEVPEGAKAGLTVVETSADTYTYYGIVIDGGVQCWKPLAGVAARVDAPVTVKVALYRVGSQNTVKYSIVGDSGDTLLTYNSSAEIAIAGDDATISSVEYRGQCELSVLSAMAWAKVEPGQKNDSIDLNPPAGSTEIPSSVAFNREDMRTRGVDPDDATAVAAYLSTIQSKSEGKNGQYGWVNVALGIADDVIVGVQSNSCTKSFVTVDFGLTASDGATLTYKVDNTAGSVISTAESGVHTVTATIKKGDAEVVIANQLVGVMNTGKDTTGLTEGKTTYDIVSVPWAGFNGQPITVANLLNTAELKSGDKLHILTGDQYDTFELDENQEWEPVSGKTYSLFETPDPDQVDPKKRELLAGTAVWVEHDVASKLVLTGLGNDEKSNVIDAAPGWTLVANPTVHDFALANTLGGVGDEIIVEDVADPRQYQKDTDGVWKRWGTVEGSPITFGGQTITPTHLALQELGVDDVIKAGVGFWYVNKSTKPEEEGTVHINFGATVE